VASGSTHEIGSWITIRSHASLGPTASLSFYLSEMHERSTLLDWACTLHTTYCLWWLSSGVRDTGIARNLIGSSPTAGIGRLFREGSRSTAFPRLGKGMTLGYFRLWDMSVRSQIVYFGTDLCGLSHSFVSSCKHTWTRVVYAWRDNQMVS